MKTNFFSISLIITAFVFSLTNWAEAAPQATKKKRSVTQKVQQKGKAAPRKKSDGATIRGKVAQNDRQKIPFAEIKTELIQEIQAPEPPLPKNFKDMKPEARETWAKKFMESEKGKAFLAEKDRLLNARYVFKVKIEDDGRFVVYDVPPGKYALRGLTRKEVDGIDHVFEIFGALEILDDVDEQNLKPIEITVTPQLMAGNIAPDFSVDTWDNKAKLMNRHFRGKYLFLCFWSSKSPPSIEFIPKIQKMFVELKPKVGLELLSINLNDDRKKAVSYIVSKKLKGRHGFANGWNHQSFENYGVRSVPQFYLIGKDGKIMMTHRDFDAQFRLGAKSLEQVVADRISGKQIPVPAAPPQKPANQTGSNGGNNRQ